MTGQAALRALVQEAFHVAPPDAASRRFLALHVRGFVVRWQWHWSETILRATTDTGETATVSRRDVSRLIEAGLIELHDVAHVRLTAAGTRIGGTIS